eukprot:4769673-Alexandrium_andersonii.AAC.1
MSFAHTEAKKRRRTSAKQRRTTERSGRSRHRRLPAGGAPIAVELQALLPRTELEDRPVSE